jgi:hypothetical protein
VYKLPWDDFSKNKVHQDRVASWKQKGYADRLKAADFLEVTAYESKSGNLTYTCKCCSKSRSVGASKFAEHLETCDAGEISDDLRPQVVAEIRAIGKQSAAKPTTTSTKKRSIDPQQQQFDPAALNVAGRRRLARVSPQSHSSKDIS